MVEKRKHPLLALFVNQLMYAVISFVIVTSMSGKLLTFFGGFFFLLYLSGVYGYAHKAGTDHQKSYSKVKPSIKYPILYALIAVAYVVIPLGIHWLCRNWYVYLAVTFWNSPFYFGYILYRDGVVNLLSAGIFSAIITLVIGLGYLAGTKQFHLTALVHKLLYRPVEETEKEQ